MSDEEDHKIVFRTSQPDEAPVIAARLSDADIPFEIRIVVQASRETEAIESIEAHMRSIGAAPAEELAPPSEEGLLACPNCEAAGIALRHPCASCGFDVQALVARSLPVKDYTPQARSFCPACRDPLTFPSSKCPKCGEELEPLESGDRLCPESKSHVLFRDTKGGDACQACRVVWVDLA